MLYNLFSSLVENYPIFNVFRYLTVRTGLSMFTSMTVVFMVGGPLIKYFSSKSASLIGVAFGERFLFGILIEF